MITDKRNANIRIRRQKREEDIALLKHVPVVTVEKFNKQIHFIIQDIRFLLMQLPLVMPVTLLSRMACTFKTHNLFLVISQISFPMPVHIPNVHGSLEGETGVSSHTMPVAQGFSSPQNEKKQDQNEWSNLNTLVNIASATLSNAELPEQSPQSNN